MHPISHIKDKDLNPTMQSMHAMKFFTLLVLVALMAPFAVAQDVAVNLYVLNLGKYDVATGSFSADFYLSLTCDDECPGDFEFMNGRAASIDTIIDEPDEKFYRIVANLNSPVDLREFPFDTQSMHIRIEDKTHTSNEVTYVPDTGQSGIDDSIAFTGWNIDGWSAESVAHEYGVYNETYSQYVFSIAISRIPLSSFFKTFLPVLFMVLIVMFTFIMDPDKITTRLTVSTSSLVASVMFHISISNQIPPVGYLTNADKFMVLTYFLFLLCVAINVGILELLERKNTELAEKIHRRTEYLVFFIVPAIYAIFFLLVMW